MPDARILLVTTSHATFDNSERPTGLWWDEFAEPVNVFGRHGYTLDVATPQGGEPPVDPVSLEAIGDTADAAQIRSMLRHAMRLADVDADRYDAVFLVGGHGTMWDFPDNPELGEIISTISAQGTVAAVCHGVAGLIGATAEGDPLVRGRDVTAFSDAEEVAAGADRLIPFSLEQRLSELGAKVSIGEPFSSHVRQDGRLVTGQNPQSSQAVAEHTVRLVAGS